LNKNLSSTNTQHNMKYKNMDPLR